MKNKPERRGRKPLPKGEKRNFHLGVMLTGEENRQLARDIKAAAVPRAVYLRKRLLATI